MATLCFLATEFVSVAVIASQGENRCREHENTANTKQPGKPTRTINGRVVYFGAYGTTESRDAYDAFITRRQEAHATPAATTIVGQRVVSPCPSTLSTTAVPAKSPTLER
ncbi:hypothetical protein [Thalassoglobus neptunius]|uniref:hypothetical protein n=1 Tax=Thalassoglobus neptunius TaxID=1938619 RepID=UPI0011B38048|nr:hypothetical protein [Thalassoglobus neptunius]